LNCKRSLVARCGPFAQARGGLEDSLPFTRDDSGRTSGQKNGSRGRCVRDEEERKTLEIA
jgi:hypothetical protein